MDDAKSRSLKARTELAALAVRASLLRLLLKAGLNPDQPRVPAGEPDGGQWAGDDGSSGGSSGRGSGSGGASAPGGNRPSTNRIVRDRSGEKPWKDYVERRRPDGQLISTTIRNRTGSTIVSEWPKPGLDRNSVTLRDGSRIVFENSGDTQRIHDAGGRLISEAVWTPDGPVAQPTVQPVFFDSRRPGRLLKTPAEVVLDAGIELYNWWLSRQEPGEGVVFSFRAEDLRLGESVGDPPIWVGRRTQDEIEAACEKYLTVQSMTDQAAATLKRNMFKTGSAYGTAIHLAVKRMVNGGDGPSRNPDFRAEVSILKTKQEAPDVTPYGTRGSVRIDVLERRSDDVVCVYDLKTGRSYLSRARMLDIFYNVAAVYPKAQRVLIVEVRPKQ